MLSHQGMGNGSPAAEEKDSPTDAPALLRQILEYELRSARRYRHFISIAKVAARADNINVRQVLQPTVRESDHTFDMGDKAIILMGHTDHKGAMEALERYQSQHNGGVDIRYALACYPRDGGGVRELLSVLDRRSMAAERGDMGAIVASG